jgi:predicted nucleic acid-binding protein
MSSSARYSQAPRSPLALLPSGEKDNSICLLQPLDELMRVTRYPRIRQRLRPALAGRLINEMRSLAIPLTGLPIVTVTPDPYDNYLLAMSVAGLADFLVTGDKGDLLALKTYEGTKILTTREFLVLQKGLP